MRYIDLCQQLFLNYSNNDVESSSSIDIIKSIIACRRRTYTILICYRVINKLFKIFGNTILVCNTFISISYTSKYRNTKMNIVTQIKCVI